MPGQKGPSKEFREIHSGDPEWPFWLMVFFAMFRFFLQLLVFFLHPGFFLQREGFSLQPESFFWQPERVFPCV